MNKLIQTARAFAFEEDGAQIIEYALLVAVVSLGLIVLIYNALIAQGTSFSQWLTTVGTCLQTGVCTRAAGTPTP